MHAGGRFTLVELMIGIAIMTTLAAIAVPAVHDLKLRAMVAEQPVNVGGLNLATNGYLLADPTIDSSVLGATHPSVPGARLHRWAPAPEDFGAIGWAPDGDVRCSYAFTITRGWSRVWSDCDADEDGILRTVDVWGHQSLRSIPGPKCGAWSCSAEAAGFCGLYPADVKACY